MKTLHESTRILLRRGAAWGVAAVVSAAAFAPAAFAADYRIFGQVRQIDPRAAADTSIPTASLPLGGSLPFVPVAVFNRDTGARLDTSWTAANGQYTLRFSAGSPVNVEVRAFSIADGGLSQLPPAREGINDLTLTSLGTVTAQGLVVRVPGALITEAGTASSPLPYPGVGIVFTRVGKVEIPYIEQRLANSPTHTVAVPAIGLADMSGDTARAHELGLPEDSDPRSYYAVFEQAPFSDRLLIFGGFGVPGGGAGCTGPIDWYQITIDQITESSLPSATPGVTSSFTWTDPMSKKRYAVQTAPLIDVTTTDVKIGPYAGSMGVAGGTSIAGLYLVNEEPPSTTRQVFYSFPDLRVNWVTSGRNGLFRLRTRYFRHLGWEVANEVPIVEEIPASCFIGALPPSASGAAVGSLVVRVDNHSLDARFNHLWVRNSAGYLAPGGGRVPTTAGALDFNSPAGRCAIMEGDTVEVGFTARQEGGYLRAYGLSAVPNTGTTVVFPGADFHGSPTAPQWFGTPVGGTTVTATGFHTCAYIFTLSAQSRLQNGYYYVQGAWPQLAYYVRQ